MTWLLLCTLMLIATFVGLVAGVLVTERFRLKDSKVLQSCLIHAHRALDEADERYLTLLNENVGLRADLVLAQMQPVDHVVARLPIQSASTTS